MNPRLFISFLLFCLSLSVAATGQDTRKTMIKEGVSGYVRVWEGDFMPTITDGSSRKRGRSGTIKPVAREILFYQPLKFTELTKSRNSPYFYEEPKDKFVKKANSDAEGFFEIELPPGRYSVLIKEEQGYYASSGDGQGFVMPVEVSQGKVTKVELKITYRSTW
jgi:hypothetical protein